MPNLLDQCIKEKRLIRHEWSGQGYRGRQLLCLYTALAGSAEARPETCPVSLCPPWLAELLPWIDDEGTDADWHRTVKRVAAVAPALGRIRGKTSTKLWAACAIHFVRQFRAVAGSDHTEATRPLVDSACAAVVRWLESVGGRSAPALREAAGDAVNALGAAPVPSAAPVFAKYVLDILLSADHSPEQLAGAIDYVMRFYDDPYDSQSLIDQILTEVERVVAALPEPKPSGVPCPTRPKKTS